MLFRIAQRFGVSLAAIIAANGIPNPNRIYVGQVLVIFCPALWAYTESFCIILVGRLEFSFFSLFQSQGSYHDA